MLILRCLLAAVALSLGLGVATAHAGGPGITLFAPDRVQPVTLSASADRRQGRRRTEALHPAREPRRGGQETHAQGHVHPRPAAACRPRSRRDQLRHDRPRERQPARAHARRRRQPAAVSRGAGARRPTMAGRRASSGPSATWTGPTQRTTSPRRAPGRWRSPSTAAGCCPSRPRRAAGRCAPARRSRSARVCASRRPGRSLSYRWDFDDGATAVGSHVTHAYTSPATCRRRSRCAGPADRPPRCKTSCGGVATVDVRVGEPPTAAAGGRHHARKRHRQPAGAGLLGRRWCRRPGRQRRRLGHRRGPFLARGSDARAQAQGRVCAGHATASQPSGRPSAR